LKLHLGGLIPFAIGLYFCLVAYGVVSAGKPSPELDHWKARFLGPLKVLAPLVLLFGIAELLGAF
jgi:hypothetical protein